MIKNVICDIDGVLMQDNHPLPGAATFIDRLNAQRLPYLLLTNYPSLTPGDLHNRLSNAGLHVPAEHFYTSAMATAAFLARQEGRKAYVIGDAALTHELYGIGFTMTDTNPDFVIVGETQSYNWEMIRKASWLLMQGARFIATNPDVAGPKGHPACGAMCAPIERISGKSPFYVGKPNPWMMRAAINRLGGHAEETAIVGDNMATDILAGVQAGIDTILVLSGCSKREDLDRFPYRPMHIFNGVADIDVF